jgi:GT2 family glycosyltransferase
VSVVIPTFNRADLVVRAVESVRAQHVEDVEIIVVDDGSTDDTPAALARLARADARLVHLQQSNAGVVAARNHGLGRARGLYVALLDSDDEWHPWKLTAQLAVLEQRPDVGMCWSDMTAEDGDGRVIAERYLRKMYRAYRRVDETRVLPDARPLHSYTTEVPFHAADAQVRIGRIYPLIVAGNLVHTSTVVLRRRWVQEIGGFDPALAPSGEDHDFHLRTARLGLVALVDVPLVTYRIGAPDQLTRPELQPTAARNFFRTIDKAVAFHDGDPLPRSLVRFARAEAHCWSAQTAIGCGEYVAGVSHAARGVVRAPTDRRQLRTMLRALAPRTAQHVRLWMRRVRRPEHRGP